MLESLGILAAAGTALIPIYIYLFRMNRTLGNVEATCRHNEQHLKRLNADVEQNRKRILTDRDPTDD